ncbi:protein SYS1 homolog isoform X2 [Cimex lectularius]|uniref:Protein SYS1 homolog n=1 Tax=Cimex lectularius TaxID=79782 RepID=A0A8I6SLV5_CIMLE|nr:protein SYS1 homolog isoform X2 [Cimex lectularius]XP_024081311.1 protein SYS1 homolog isoform X2 [Cimex lectularius]
MSKLSGQFRNTAWDPLLIIGQIIAVQSVFYFTLGVWLVALDILSGSPRSLAHIFKYQELHKNTFVVVGSYLLNSFTGAVNLWCIVQRTKLCLDFAATAHLIHMILCWIYNGYFPTSLPWWLLNITDASIMCAFGEYLCRGTELKAIPLSTAPKFA